VVAGVLRPRFCEFWQKTGSGQTAARRGVAKVTANNYDCGVYERSLPEKERFEFCFFRSLRIRNALRSGGKGKMRSQKYGADKVVLLGLFIVALLTARLITVSRSAIVLSEPVELNYSGLSLSIPAGSGWQSEKQWRYQGNAFILSSFFNSGSGSVTALARCQYLLAAARTGPEILFEQKSRAVDGVIVKTGRTRAARPPLTIDWAHIKKPETLFDMFFGTVQLPNSRQLNIEVYQTTGDTDLTRQAFDRITESLRFKDNRLLEAGSEIIAEIKSKGIDSFLGGAPALAGNKQGRNREAFFLIKDSRNRAIGFSMDVLSCRFARLPDAIGDLGDSAAEGSQQAAALVDSGQEAQLNIEAIGLLYIRGRSAREQTIFFQSRNNLDEFAWKSEAGSSAGKSSLEVVLGKGGVMTVREYGPRPKEKNYRLSAAAIPEVLLDLAFSQLLERDDERIIVDVIEADGKIIPTLVSRIDVEDSAAAESDPVLQRGQNGGDEWQAEQKVAYVLKTEPLDGGGFSEQLYLDAQRRISKRLLRSPNAIKGVLEPLRQKGMYTLQRCSVEDMLEQFPERADYILAVSGGLSRRSPVLQRDGRMGARKQ